MFTRFPLKKRDPALPPAGSQCAGSPPSVNKIQSQTFPQPLISLSGAGSAYPSRNGLFKILFGFSPYPTTIYESCTKKEAYRSRVSTIGVRKPLYLQCVVFSISLSSRREANFWGKYRSRLDESNNILLEFALV